MVLSIGVALHQHAAHRHLGFRLFRQADTHGVSEAIFEQGADAQGGFDASVFAVAGFRDAQMERKRHAFVVHPRHEQAVRLNHDLRVGRLHGHDHVEVVLRNTDAQELQSALDHAQRGVAVAAHDPVGQGAVVGANAHGAAQTLALLDEGGEFFPNADQFLGVGLVGVLQVFKPLLVGVIAWVHPHLFHVVGRDFRSVGGEVNVRHQRGGVPS